jgi:hypothetical protein
MSSKVGTIRMVDRMEEVAWAEDADGILTQWDGF